MQDLSNMVIAGEMREPVTTLKMTEEMQKKLHEKYERYLEEYCNLEELDFEKYRDEGGYDEEGQKRFQSRCITVQQLSASGYTRSQIKHLYKLIMADFGAEKIMSIFPRETSTKQIDNFSKVFWSHLVMSVFPTQMYCEGTDRRLPLILRKGEKQLWEQIWF